MNRVELVMARRQVNALILTDPIDIVPVRKTKVPDGSGGWRYTTSTPTEPIQVLLVPAKRRPSEMKISTELGDVTLYPYIILARHTADLRSDDTFTWQGDEFEVKSIGIETEVSVTAQVDFYGGSNG